MNVKQNLSILLYLKRRRAAKDGRIPIYIRITIDGLKDEFSPGHRVFADNWDSQLKIVKPAEPDWKAINKRLSQAKTDIERHFYLMQAKHGLATPAMVKQSYLTPISAQQIRNEKVENLELSEAIDDLIEKYIAYCEKVKKAYKHGRTPAPERSNMLDIEKGKVERLIEQQVRKANCIFDRKDHKKTFLLLLNEYLLNFLQLAFTGHRSPNTLEKWIGRKRRYIEFLQYRYTLEDTPLQEMEYKFIDEIYKYLLVQHHVIPNTAMKYAQCVKELMDRAAAKGWINNNVFAIFKCRYSDPHHDWLTMQELERLKDTDFKEERLNVIRDIFLFSSFTGLSYQEVSTLKPADIITGVNGKKWISKNRQKTGGDETLPLLPLPLQLLDKYRDHPLCVRRGRLLPVPTNEQYNRCLKDITKIGKFNAILRTHKARYFFANEVAYNNGVPLKTVSKMLGHKSVKTTEVYVRANRQNISDNMEMVEKKMFGEDGKLINPRMAVKPENSLPTQVLADAGTDPGARVIRMHRG
jgi:integrase